MCRLIKPFRDCSGCTQPSRHCREVLGPAEKLHCPLLCLRNRRVWSGGSAGLGFRMSEISLPGHPGLSCARLVVAENAPFAATEGNYEGVGEILQKLDNVLPLSPEL